jgi:hypothetical protein
MKKQLLLFLLLISFSGFISNAQDCYWAAHAGGELTDGGVIIALDKQGNSYVAGLTQCNYCFFQTDSIWAGQNNALFIAKYNSLGEEQWVKKIGGGNIIPDCWVSFGRITFDSISDCLLVNGTFYNNAYFGDTLLTGSLLTIFVIKMSPEGNIIWARAVGGDGEDIAYGITTDEQGNVYIAGSNQNEASIGGAILPAGGFLAKYDQDGNLLWAKNMFRPQSVASYNLKIANQSLYVIGDAYGDTIFIDTSVLVNTFSDRAVIQMKFNLEGNVQHSRLLGLNATTAGSQSSFDQFGNFFVSGIFHETSIFENDTLFNSVAYDDCFFAKYTLDGDLIWVNQLNSTSDAWSFGSIADDNGNVYFSGFFQGSATFGNQMLTSKSMTDMYVTLCSSSGDFLGVRTYGEGIVRSLKIDQSNNLYLTGVFKTPLLIASDTLISQGEWDMFVAKCSEITGEEELKINPQNQLLIYANPNTGRCNITIPEEFANEKNLVLQIFDLQGKLIQQSKIEIVEGKIRLDIRAQAKGMYTAVLSNGKRSYTGKIVFE